MPEIEEYMLRGPTPDGFEFGPGDRVENSGNPYIVTQCVTRAGNPYLRVVRPSGYDMGGPHRQDLFTLVEVSDA